MPLLRTRKLSRFAVPALLLAFAVLAVADTERRPRTAAKADDGLLSPFDAEVQLGDRLFFETRFAQFYFARCDGKVNARLREGDPVVAQVEASAGESLDGPFRGESMSCRHCHLGDDFLAEDPLAGRTYCDFSRRSEIPARGDGLTRTPRNSPMMIDLGLAREAPMLLHLDGEFVTHEDLVIDTMTGRNLGWLPHESRTAAAHIAKVIREDTGLNPRHVTYTPGGRGIPYRVVMLGTDSALPSDLRLPKQYRLDVDEASEDEILMMVARLMHAYMDSLRFGTTRTMRESSSPYDVFLRKNDLPAVPNDRETNRAYADRLLGMIEKKRGGLMWVTDEDAEFELHTQEFEFGAAELRGLETFFARGGASKAAHVGNCVSCHPPPRFTDHSLHNNGASQIDYDAIFGEGAFAALDVPDLKARNGRPDAYLPATARRPGATGRFKSAPSADKPGYADLGVWNVFANPDMPKPQRALTTIFCGRPGPAAKGCTPEAMLPLTIATFKTPSIRDLGQSTPYFHTGAMETVEDVVRFYVATSDLARAEKVRNGSPELADIRLGTSDVAPLSAFLRSLNEDYQ